MKDLCHLLRVSLGFSPVDDFPQLNDEQWKALKAAAVKQTVLGIAWGGIEKLPLEKQPPRRMKLQWLADTNEIKHRNEWMDKACAAVSKKLEKVGLYSAILKGQAIAQLYPTPEYRSPGDIDALVSLCPPVMENGKLHFLQSPDIDKTVKIITQKLKSIGKGDFGKTVYHHIEWQFSDVAIEVHLRPMQFNDPFVNMRFQQWAKSFYTDSTNTFVTPDVEFNIIFLLSHLYHHLLFEGVGLRQVCDYAVLLHAAEGRGQRAEVRGKSEELMDKSRINKLLNELKMQRFAAGMMWIMQTMFGLSRDALITEPDANLGTFILDEIRQAGNFGKYDDRIDHEKLSSTTGKFWVRTKHRARFLTLFPSEILWDIPFRLWHWTWRKRQSL